MNNATRWMSVVGLAALPLGAWAQHAHEQDQGLVHVGETSSFDRDRWAAALTAQDLDQREHNFDSLVELARLDPDAQRALEDWSKSDAAGLAWTARLALRELDESPALAWFGNGPRAGNTHRMRMRFGDLRDRLHELETMLDDLDMRSDSLRADASAPDQRAHQESHTFSLEVGPDGARVSVEEMVDGKQETREYEAESLDELLAAHPELRDKIEGRGTMLRLRSKLGGFGIADWEGDLRVDDLNEAFGFALREPPTHVLGIEFESPPAEVVSELGLEPGVGLFVVRTLPGTIAHILGLKRSDVVVELNDNPLYTGEDVSRVLRERLPGADVVVTIVDAKGQRRVLTWKPSDRPR